MLFQVKLNIVDMRLHEKVRTTFNYGPPRNIEVAIVPPASDASRKNLICTATTTREPSQKIFDVFKSFAEGNLNPSSAPATVEYSVKSQGRQRGPMSKYPSGVPAALESYAESIYRELTRTARKTLSVLRWRLDVHSTHSIFSKFTTSGWSIDGKAWFTLPLSTSAIFEVMRDLRLNDNLKNEVLALVENDEEEPIQHVLFREAWNQRFENPRSSLIIGMAAAEVGVKRCIATLIPESEWLVEHVPTPPLMRLVQEYLPTLPLKNAYIQLNEDVIKLLKKGVTIRNEVTHRGKSIDPEGLNNILSAIHDLLRILDYYLGYDWSLSHVADDTLRHLTDIDTKRFQPEIDLYRVGVPVNSQIIDDIQG